MPEDGLIALEAAEADRRVRHVVLTAEGKVTSERAQKLWRRAQERFEAVFGTAASNDLRAVLIGIARNERLSELDDPE